MGECEIVLSTSVFNNSFRVHPTKISQTCFPCSIVVLILDWNINW